MACLVLASLIPSALRATAQSQAVSPHDPFAEGFLQPPEAAKPRTWWHWTNGNVSEAGITKDLEWMKRSGIGGFQLVDVAAGSGQTVDPKTHFATPEWYHAVRHSAEEARRLGLEMSIFSCAGWSEAGGPWVTQQMAMKKLVWSETQIEGAHHVDSMLAAPPSNEGPVRDSTAGSRPGAPHFYADSAVVAYRTPAQAVPMATLQPKITTSRGPIDGAALLDGRLTTSVTIPAPSDGSPAWLQYEFAQPYTARALSFGSGGRIPIGRALASDDGVSFRTIVDLPGPQGYHGASIRTFAFPAVTAKFFRIELSGAGRTPAAVIHGAATIPATSFTLTEAIFYSDARVNRWEDKGAFGSLMDVYDVVPTPPSSDNAQIARGDVLDVADKMDRDGRLRWDAPPGRWTVLRMGYSLTGARNRPSVPAGSGYEVDKLNAKHVQQYFKGYVDPLQQHLGDLLGSTAHYMTMDSWEAGMQNWTEDMLAEFAARRGYDPRPYLPVLAGRVVGSAEISDRFLWDFRRTLADMFAENFYGTMDSELHRKGLEAYAEASGVALEIPEDTLLNKSKVDIPMAEFWVHALHPESMYYVDVRGAASAAHIYGKPIVATEAFTGGGYESPFTLKKIADYWFAQGVNRLVFHTSAHQPLDTKPGNTMVGTHLNRNITWAEQAQPFMSYLARVSYMLQQGSPVADLAYLLPEGAPSTMPFWGSGLAPAPPPGFDYDYLNTDVLLHHTRALPDGRLHVEGSPALPEGMTYRLLVLPPTTLMTPAVLTRLHELVTAGVTITGPRPVSSPSLAGFPDADSKVQSLAADLWGDIDGVTLNQHPFGKGTTYSGLALEEVFSRLKTTPDIRFNQPVDNPPVWVHRRTTDADVFFVANQSDMPQEVETLFRVAGKAPEIWRPMDGSMTGQDGLAEAAYSASSSSEDRSGNRQPGLQPAAYIAQSGYTSVPLRLAARESVFVVFRHAAATPSRTEPAVNERTIQTLSGPWTLTFPAHSGAPPRVTLQRLTAWNESTDAGIKYFSGTAIYAKTMQVSAAILRSGKRVWLDLGDVHDVAQVKVNGTPAGVSWAPPFRLDMTHMLHPGSNTLEIAVTNEWTNRLTGDRDLPAGQKVLSAPETTTPGLPSNRPRPLLASGLLGEVRLIVAATR